MTKNRKDILVTGAGGFIGANLVKRLLNLNYNIHVVWKKTTNPWRINDVIKKISIHEISLLNKKELAFLLMKINPSIIYHLATHGAYHDQNNINIIVKTNIISTLNLLSASKDIDYDIFVNFGSSSEYGFKEKPMKEKDLLEPESFYAAAKASSSLLCQVFSKNYHKAIVTLRPFSVYGPYEEFRRFIPTIINDLIDNHPINLTAGSIRRDFIYIDDFIDLCVKLIGKEKVLSGKIFNVGSGREYSNLDVVKTLFKISKKNVPINIGAYPKRVWDTQHWRADISNTKLLLRWRPKVSLENGLLKTYRWMLKNKKLYEK